MLLIIYWCLKNMRIEGKNIEETIFIGYNARIRYSIPIKNMGKVLVLAPHPDDETIGCAGTILELQKKNVEIEVVLFTLPKDEKRAKIRLKEFTKVMNYLGCKINKICQYPDGETKMVKDRIKSTLQEIIINENPDIIFTPYILDYHLDHRVISMILAEIVKQSMTLIAMYEVWVPILHPNCYVDITEVWEKKKNALLQYQSQEKEYSIIGKSKVLNSLRAQLSFRKNVKYVESFRCMNGKQFARNAILLDAKILKGGE